MLYHFTRAFAQVAIGLNYYLFYSPQVLIFKTDNYHSTVHVETAILSHQNKEHDCRTNLYRMPSSGCILY